MADISSVWLTARGTISPEVLDRLRGEILERQSRERAALLAKGMGAVIRKPTKGSRQSFLRSQASDPVLAMASAPIQPVRR